MHDDGLQVMSRGNVRGREAGQFSALLKGSGKLPGLTKLLCATVAPSLGKIMFAEREGQTLQHEENIQKKIEAGRNFSVNFGYFGLPELIREGGSFGVTLG